MSEPRETVESVPAPKRPGRRRWRRKLALVIALAACFLYVGAYASLRLRGDISVWTTGNASFTWPNPEAGSWRTVVYGRRSQIWRADFFRPCIAVETWWINR